MFNFICSSWEKIKHKFNKILPLFCVFVFIFISPVRSYAASDKTYIESSSLVTWYSSATPKLRLSDINNTALYEGDCSALNNLNEFFGGNGQTNAVYHIRLYNNSHSINFQYLPEVYDYWISFTAFSQTTNVSEFTFVPDRIQIFERNCDDNGTYTYHTLSNLTVLHNDDSSDIGFTCVGKIPNTLTSNSPVGFRITDSSTGSVGYNLRLQAYIYAVPKSSGVTSSDISGIVSAILSQTSTLGGKLDNTNNLINNGNGSTSGIVSGANSSKTELESIVADYQQIENNMLDNFTLYQSDILSDVTGWSWGGLSTCANWVGDTLTSYFQNMGDFKQYIIYPLLLGIALFFIGRGSSIIGHLYRKPTVTTTISNRESVTYKQNGTKYTDSKTTTYRDGGVLRK